jgi:F-type H+-transporting ATPase subunit b
MGNTNQLFAFNWDFVWTILNLTILYFVLRKLLFKRVTAFMDKRSEGIADEITGAEHMGMEAAALKENYERIMKNAEEKAAAIVTAAKAKAEEDAQKLIKEAGREAESIIERATIESALQKKGIVKAARDQIVDIALSLSSKILKKNMNDKTNAEYIKTLFDEDGAA